MQPASTVPALSQAVECERCSKVALGSSRNVLAKSYGSRNPINVVRMTIKALGNIRSPDDIGSEAR